jgi:hypothetical protein
VSKPLRCDACDRRIRRSHHELILRDFDTRQVLGRYHVRRECRDAASKYFKPGVAIGATFVHPDRCGPDHEHCDAGAFEVT